MRDFMAQVTLAVDAMGGDTGLPVTVPAVAQLLKRHATADVLMVGQPAPLATALRAAGLADHARVRVVPASEIVAMDDPVAVALRNKKDSSMRVAVNQLREG